MTDEMILVPRAELLAWAKAWLNDYDPNDGTDCVTPFDTYLLKSPVEVQGGREAELRHMVAKLAAHVRPTCGVLWAEAERLLNRTAPPSAPVGVSVDVVREYLDARACYEEATRRPNSHAPAPVLKHGDPVVLRLREARVALDNAIAFAQQPAAFNTAAAPTHAQGSVEQQPAAVDAEIEALRVDIEAWKASHSMLTDTCHHFQARAKQLEAALRMIEKGSPVEAPDLNDWADADERVDVVENNLRWHFGKIARAVLRDHDNGEQK